MVAPRPITATRIVSLGPADRDEPSAPITILGIPSASPAVIERFRNFLRVIVFIGLVEWLRCRRYHGNGNSALRNIGARGAERCCAATMRRRRESMVMFSGSPAMSTGSDPGMPQLQLFPTESPHLIVVLSLFSSALHAQKATQAGRFHVENLRLVLWRGYRRRLRMDRVALFVTPPRSR